MAENVLETRILLRYGTYSQWMNSNVILKLGEAAVCAFPNNRVIDGLSNTTPENTPPAIGIKIGDGIHYFYELPWVQAVAADVYNWAKTANKPTYTASEISGLQSFIEENFHISGDVTIAPRIYQIVQGTDDNEHKYFLRYKENNEDGQWILDSNHPIDLTQYAAISEWIGDLVERYPTLGTFTATQTGRLLNNLNYTDTANSNQFVTSVSEEAGIISVERAQPTFSNIAGIANVQQGGTGRNTLTEDNVLVGNGTDQVKLIPLAETIDTSSNIVTSKIVKTYVDSSVAGLAKAMHFIGEASVVITPNSQINPQITDYEFSQAQPGDVIIYNAQEFVWDGGRWILLGDERNYITHGNIVDSDIHEEANISQSKIAGLDDTLSTKVDKVEGKTLTSNDFTDELKQKLEDIGINAETNVIEHILLNGVEVPPVTIDEVPKTVNLQIQEFTEAAQSKLNTIEIGAQANKIEKVIYDGTEIIPDTNKTITITSDPHTEHENVIESIVINNQEQPIVNKQVNITIDQEALNLNVVAGAEIPKENNSGKDEVEQISKKLQLARIAATGNVKDLLQANDEYIILFCGSSTEVV